MAISRREHLIETASELFNRNGFHATGIDRIIAEAGVAKMTLYNHFRSKDELILAVLRRRDEAFRHWFTREVDRRAKAPLDKLRVVFDVLESWFDSKEFRGCIFINAGAESGAGDSMIRSAASEHKRLIIRYLEALARDAGLKNPDGLAAGLAMLMDGATVMAQLGGSSEPARTAKQSALCLIDAALPQPA